MFLPQQPVHFSGVPRGIAQPAPRLGGDTTAILEGLLHLSPADIAHLLNQGAIAKENR